MTQPKPIDRPPDVVGRSALPDAGLPTDERRTTWHVSSSAIGARLIERVRDAGPDGMVFIARSESKGRKFPSAARRSCPSLR